MKTHETTIKKGYYGHTAKSEHSLGIVPATEYETQGERFVQISTSKGSRGGINSSAGIIIRRQTQHGISEQTALFQDYTKTLLNIPCARVTEKAILEAHKKALEQFEAVIAEATAFYNQSAA